MTGLRDLLRGTAALIYRTILRGFPRDFREDAVQLVLEFGVATSRSSERGLASLIGTCSREIFDLARNLIPAWIATLRAWPPGGVGRGMMSWDSIGQDIRFALRGLRRQAGLTAAIVATMAIAIGGTTATFGVVDAVLLEPLPYPDSGELVYLYESFRETQIKSVSYPNFRDWRADNRVFKDLAARTSWGFTMTGDGDAQELSGMLLTPNVLDVLGVQPSVGRMFTSAETEAGERLVLLSDGFWRTAFGADAAVVGRSLTLNGEPYLVIGVLPQDIDFPISEADVWAPISTLSDNDLGSRGSHPGIGVVGRLMPGVTLGDARADMDRVTAALEDRFPDTNAEAGAVVTPIMDIYVGGSRRTLWLFLAAVGMVLLIACANVASLMLVQAGARTREAAVRVAVGASRMRLVRLVLTESVMLGLGGGVAGLGVAASVLHIVRTVQPGRLPRLETVGLDAGLLAFTLTVSLLTSLLFGLGPALRVSSSSPALGLNSGGRAASARSGRARRTLIVFEVATAFVLLVGAGLMIRSVDNLLTEDAGIATANRLTFRASVPMAAYPTVAERSAFYGQLVKRLETLPGVASVAGGDPLPMSRSNRQMAIANEGFPQLDEAGLRVDVAVITPGYFETFDIALVAGRAFDGRETAESPSVIVDEMLAATLWPGEAPLGRQLRLREDGSPWMTVVGVAPHVRHYGVQWEARAKMYFPYTARVWSLSMIMVADGDPASLVSAVRDQLAQLDPNVPLTRVATMSELRADTISDEALSRRVLEIFGLIALVLAMIGLYGVLSHSVAQRTREIGIRVALGARARGVLADVVKEGVALSGLGVALGLGGAFLATRTLDSLLYEVGSFDAVTIGVAASVLLSVAVGATLLPASRAVRVDPCVALRNE